MNENNEIVHARRVHLPVFLRVNEIEYKDLAEYHIRVVDNSEREEREQHHQSIIQIQF